ncbi:MAG: PAS domain S-box protein [Opitutaceae bacterium]|nr:PAS domain S-box protein [Opitutaceae bacterium]
MNSTEPPSHPRRTAADADAVSPAGNRELELISENFPEGALYQYTQKADGRQLLTYLGRGFERIFGERPAEMPADVSWLTVRIHPDDEPGMAAAGEASHREMTRFQCEVRIRAADGTERWVSFRSSPRATADGSVVWDGAVIDVTERRQAEEAVRRQADFLAALNQTTLDLLGRRKVAELLHALVERAATLLRSPHAEISLLEGDELVVHAFSAGHSYLAGDRARRSERVLSWRAIDTKTPVVTDDYASEAESRLIYRERGIRSAAVFPILRGTECMGVLGLAREQPDIPFTAEDVREATLLARMAALVLHNAAIHEEAVHAAETRTIALRESEEKYRGVFDQSPIVIGLLSVPEGRIVELNAAACEAFGYAREEALGKTSVELGLWADPETRNRYLAELREKGSVHNYEAEMRRKNGQTFTVLYSGSLVTIAGHLYSLNSIQDITERKQSEAARDRSLSLMRATLDSTADGILVVNAAGGIETYNQNFAAMWALPDAGKTNREAEERVIRQILDQLVAPELFLASVRDVYSGSDDEVFDFLECKDGRILERNSRPQLVGSQIVGRVWSFRDITDQRLAEAALRESEERFRVLAKVAPVGIFSSDPTGRCMFVNNRWCELAGMTPGQAMGEGWKAAVHPDDRAAVAAGWAEAVRTHESSTAEFRFRRPDGGVSWLVGQSRAHHTADGALAGYVGTITDVTSLKRAEEERKKNEAQSRQSRKMEALGTLAGGIAHDFNNILTGTFGFLDLARLELPAEHSAHTWLDRIAASSQRARELVRQILTFSRKNEGERVPQRLHVVIGEALRLLRSTLPPMVELETHIAPDAPPVLADATQVHQVVLNLCTNAWHAMGAKDGKIVVCLEGYVVTAADSAAHPELRPRLWTRLTVSDNGSGMDPETLEQIFEPFFTTKEMGAGTGLGLAVVHGIVKSYDGTIVVRSAVGAGSTFELYFPVAVAEVERPAVPPTPMPRGNGERILVVDDDAVSGFAVEKLIESLGYNVSRCTRPEEALARFAAAPLSFDLIVSDLAMPGMDGAELIRHLIQIRPELPVLIVSGYLETARQRLLEKSPARAILRKPVGREELARALAQSLREVR